MSSVLDGRAIVYCQDSFRTTNGKTAHGLVRKTRRYDVLSVIDRTCVGNDAGFLLDGVAKNIPFHPDLRTAIQEARDRGQPAEYLVIGLAPDGGRMDSQTRQTVLEALQAGLNVDAGLHDFLSDIPEFVELAQQQNVRLRDVRKTPARSELHAFSGKIDEVDSFRVAVLGTDSAVGKRTTSWCLVDGFLDQGLSAEMVGTGQTAWMQGARFSIILDSLINDFVAGELEHAVWSAWRETSCDVVVVEGQGSLMHPAYPGGFEILAATKPHVIVLQHAPARTEYDGFPGQLLDPLAKQIEALRLISGKPVVAITINHENLSPDETRAACATIERETGIPTTDVLLEGPGRLVSVLMSHLNEARDRGRRP